MPYKNLTMAKHETAAQSDEWYTPLYIFEAMHRWFDMDVAAPVDRTYCKVPADVFITENSLEKEWKGFVWMNPPFGGRNSKGAWLDKIKEHGSGVALVPDRTSAPWWQKAAKEADAILQISGKVKFIKPDGSSGDSPSTGTTLFGYGYYGVEALMNAQKNGLGIVFKRVTE